MRNRLQRRKKSLAEGLPAFTPMADFFPDVRCHAKGGGPSATDVTLASNVSRERPSVTPPTQLHLFSELKKFPQTRYQGSKRKLLRWIWDHIKDLDFTTCLDALGGTGCVAYLLKVQRKAVTYNDLLRSNYLIGKALVENSHTKLEPHEVEQLIRRHPSVAYPDFIQRTFRGIYFNSKENAWLDTVCGNIKHLGDEYKQAVAYYALFQACIVKRPYNLFHRANLYMRTSDVPRSFGNKATWDRPFEEHFRKYALEASEAVFDSGVPCLALNQDVFEMERNFDLVYIDPPYMNRKGVGPDYFAFYHFLEGIADYDRWASRIDETKKHLPLRSPGKCIWLDRKRVLDAFDALFEKFSKSILVISYRTDGIPSPDQLVALLRHHNKKIRNFSNKNYKYVLSSNGSSREALIVAT